MRKGYLLGWMLLASSVCMGAGLPQKINTFPITDVRLISGPFKHAESMDICYLLGLAPDRLLAPYMKEAGLQPKAENYPNWENTGLDGHIGGIIFRLYLICMLLRVMRKSGNAWIISFLK